MTVEQLLADFAGLSDAEIARRLEQEYPDWIVWRYPPGPWWAMRQANHRRGPATVRAYTVARLIRRIDQRQERA